MINVENNSIIKIILIKATCDLSIDSQGFQWGSRGLKVKFKFSLSPEANIVMYIHIHGDILTGYWPKVYLTESPN